MRGLITALRTLTRIPCPGQDADSLAFALPFFPWIGALIGGLTLIMAMAVRWVLPFDFLAAVIPVLFLAWLTRGLHLDGLADTADALGGGQTIERRLAIMKDPHVGAFGVITLIGALLLKIGAFQALIEISRYDDLFSPSFGHFGLSIALPFIVSRTVQVWLCVALPYARATGGTAGPFVAGAQWPHWAFALAGALCLCAFIHPILGALLLAAGLIVGLALRRFFRSRFGGITGDLLGASNEIIEIVTLLLLAFLLTRPDIVPIHLPTSPP